MNFPFRFAAADADDILVLNDQAANLILAALAGSTYTDAQKARFALLNQPIIPAWLLNYSITADKDCVVEIGLYNQTADTFIPLYPTVLLAAGSNTHDVVFTQGFCAPYGGALVPALKVVTGTAVILAGHAEYIPNLADRDEAPIAVAASGSPTALLTELLTIL